MNHQKIAVGLDIGTTTVSAIVLDVSNGLAIKVYNVPNDSKIVSEKPCEFIQSPHRIWEIVKNLLDDILKHYLVTSIGVTGQMHGILLISPAAEPLSPLYTWQDISASAGENSSCEQLEKLTKTRVPAGYGLATLYHLIRVNKVPKVPYVTGTIMDYITMKLCGLSRPVMHITNAASWGFFNTFVNNFDFQLLKKAGIPDEVLPIVTAEKAVVGKYQGIPVSVAVGDNQAAFMGAVSEPRDTVLVNIGTGSQISLLSEQRSQEEGLSVEARPFDGKALLHSGSCLCGGRSYALLERMFRRFAIFCGMEDKPYFDVLNALAKDGKEAGRILEVSTTFAGTRENADARGAITQIGEENFTPEALSAGMLYGMAKELFDLYQKMPHEGITKLVASGNGVRKNPVLQAILEEVFGMTLTIPDHTEEAAFGAAMFGAEAI